MKLYATTTSERASKGQGGNDYLIIEVLDENKKSCANIIFYPKDKDGIIQMSLWTGGNVVRKEKGKSQKGEHKHDKDCYMQCMSKLV